MTTLSASRASFRERTFAPALRATWGFPLIKAISSRQPVILLYHGVAPSDVHSPIDSDSLERHLLFLAQHFDLIPADRLGHRRGPFERIQVLLTFDDGFRNNADVVAPLLAKHNIPAVFFVCSRHSTPGKYLWFAYLRALERYFEGEGFHFQGEFINMRKDHRSTSILQLREYLLNLQPHPVAMYQTIEEKMPKLEDFVPKNQLRAQCEGMSFEQIGELSKNRLFSFGVHTADHPLLSKCSPDESLRQIVENRAWLERASGRPCDIIAYPGGDYDGRILEQCRQIGLRHGYSVIPRLHTDTGLELPRVGIYSRSIDVLGFKVQWGNLIRTMGLKIG